LNDNDIEWLGAQNNLIAPGSKLMRYQVTKDEKAAIKLRLLWARNNTQYEIKLTPSEFLDTYDEHWTGRYDPSVNKDNQIGHYKLNSSLLSVAVSPDLALNKSHINPERAVDIEVSGSRDLGYYRFNCISGNNKQK
jgi:hypothetical protein